MFLVLIIASILSKSLSQTSENTDSVTDSNNSQTTQSEVSISTETNNDPIKNAYNSKTLDDAEYWALVAELYENLLVDKINTALINNVVEHRKIKKFHENIKNLIEELEDGETKLINGKYLDAKGLAEMESSVSENGTVFLQNSEVNKTAEALQALNEYVAGYLDENGVAFVTSEGLLTEKQIWLTLQSSLSANQSVEINPGFYFDSYKIDEFIADLEKQAEYLAKNGLVKRVENGEISYVFENDAENTAFLALKNKENTIDQAVKALHDHVAHYVNEDGVAVISANDLEIEAQLWKELQKLLIGNQTVEVNPGFFYDVNGIDLFVAGLESEVLFLDQENLLKVVAGGNVSYVDNNEIYEDSVDETSFLY